MRLTSISIALVIATLAGCRDTTAPVTPQQAPSPMVACESYDCGSGGGSTAPPPGYYFPGVTMNTCTNVAYGDTDLDGLTDSCEQLLASAFAPLLEQSPEHSYWDYAHNWVGGEYYHAATVLTGYNYGYYKYVRIMYMPAYYFDLGSFPLDAGHNGDSEFIVVEVFFNTTTNRFYANNIFLSAHCGSTKLGIGTAPMCGWWDPSNFDFVNGVDRGAPVVWVANGTNANYYKASACTLGTGFDQCIGNLDVRFPVSPDFNIGSSRVNPGPVYARRNLNIGSWRPENFWDPNSPFLGWQGWSTDPPTPYARELDNFGFVYHASTGGTPGCSGSTCAK